jgi:hypothetical protein
MRTVEIDEQPTQKASASAARRSIGCKLT